MSMALVSIAVALAPALLIGALSDDGKIENFLKRSLKNWRCNKLSVNSVEPRRDVGSSLSGDGA